MPQSSSMPPRHRRRIVPLVTSGLLLAGCDGGGSSQMADLPKAGKLAPPPAASTKGAGKVNRPGSEQGYPGQQ
jgi:hypothetical protein